MGMMTGVRRALLSGGQAAAVPVTYLLNAPFTAADQGYANAQVLDTVAEGITAGQLTVVEVDGTLAVVSNKCAFTAQVTPVWGDQDFYSQAITRALGRGLLATVNLSVLGAGSWYGFADSTASTSYSRISSAAFFMYNIGFCYVIDTGASPIVGSVPAIGVDYNFAVVLGGYDVNGVPWRSGEAAASYLYGSTIFLKGGAYLSWTRLWSHSTEATTPVYAMVGLYDPGGAIDAFRVPDVDLSATLQPNNLSLFAAAGELDAYTPEVGGGWTENTGDWDTAGGVLQATAAGIATFTGLADCVYDVKVTLPAAGVAPGGLILRGSDFAGANDDYWYAKITPGTAGTDFQLIEVNAGVETVRASADVDWTAATAYNVRVIVQGSTWWKAYVNGVEKLIYTTANVFNQAATSCGLLDEGNANFTFDNVALFARTAAVYDATLDAV